MLKWYKSESSSKPLELEIFKNSVYFRKNIAEITKTDEKGTPYIVYKYDEAFISRVDYESNKGYYDLLIENEKLKKENSINNESILDLDFRVSELEDK